MSRTVLKKFTCLFVLCCFSITLLLYPTQNDVQKMDGYHEIKPSDSERARTYKNNGKSSVSTFSELARLNREQENYEQKSPKSNQDSDSDEDYDDDDEEISDQQQRPPEQGESSSSPSSSLNNPSIEIDPNVVAVEAIKYLGGMVAACNPYHPLQRSENMIEDEVNLPEELVKEIFENCPERAQSIIRDLIGYRYGTTDNLLSNLVVLHGPPGTGKSTLAKVMAITSERKCKFIPAGLIANEYKNSAEQNLARLVKGVEKQHTPYVIIFDELDALTDGHDNQRDPNRGATKALITIADRYKDNPNLFFVGTTNRLENIPESIISRLGPDIIKIPLPDEFEREDIIRYWIGHGRNPRVFLEPNTEEAIIKKLVKATKGYSARKLEQLVKFAKNEAAWRIEKSVLTEEDHVFNAYLEQRRNGSFLLEMEDFKKSFELLKQAEKDTRRASWKKKCKDILRDYSVAIGAGVTITTAAAGFLGHKYITNQQMAQTAAQHAASMAQNAAQHAQSLAQSNRHHTQNMQATAWGGIGGAIGGVIAKFFISEVAGTSQGAAIGASIGGTAAGPPGAVVGAKVGSLAAIIPYISLGDQAGRLLVSAYYGFLRSST